MTGVNESGESPIDWQLVGAFAQESTSFTEVMAADPELLAGSEGLLRQLIHVYMEQGHSGEEAELMGHAFICGAVVMANTLPAQICAELFG